ncbi:MAG: hypothetical protein OEQ39_06730 [Gammaproteobacteria bacterium]|nr:hypothetical protein [Gammaproteobacteria bacterium]MDH3464785.1 hypothetical protein [Gammaproteobacteria bacterium]
MKQFAIGIAVLSMVSGPVVADHSTFGQYVSDKLTKENVGRAVGAGVGALIGSRIGDGRGQLAAVAAGTLAGYWIGGNVGRRLNQSDRRGIQSTTETALRSGRSQSWRNPDTGVVTRVSVQDRYTKPRYGGQKGLRAPLRQAPPIEVINDYYTAQTSSNVRGGPGTDFAIVGKLGQGEPAPVVGKVVGKPWYMVAEGGVGYGFVYAPLMVRSNRDTVVDNALRTDAAQRVARAPEPLQRNCSRLTQEIILPDGTREQKNIHACQRANGTWEAA